MNKGESEKFYNHMVKGKAWLFVSFLLSGFCVSDIELVCVVLFSSIVVSVFSSMMRSSPVFNVLEIIVSSSEDKFGSVSVHFQWLIRRLGLNYHLNSNILLILVYVNQGSVSVVKCEGQAIYVEFVVIGPLMPVANPDSSVNLETHVFKEDEALCMCLFITKQQGCMVASQKS